MLSIKRLLTALTGNLPTIAGGLVIGQERDFIGFPRSLSDEQLCKHLLVSGDPAQSARLLFQIQLAQLQRGGGGIFIDRHDEDGRRRDQLRAAAQRVGRGDVFFQIDLTSPERSATYSPLYAGPPISVACRLLRLLPPPALSYAGRATTATLLTSVITRLRTPPMQASLAELIDLLAEQRRAALMEDQAPADDRADQQVQIDLEQLGMFLVRLRDGALNPILAPSRHGIDLLQIHKQGGFCHIRMNSRPDSTLLLCLLLGEMRQALQHRLPDTEGLPFLWALDGLDQDLGALDPVCFSQARSAGLGILGTVPALWTLQDEVPGAETAVANTGCLAFFPVDYASAAHRVGDVPVGAIQRDLAGCPRHWFTLFEEESGTCLPLKMTP